MKHRQVGLNQHRRPQQRRAHDRSRRGRHCCSRHRARARHARRPPVRDRARHGTDRSRPGRGRERCRPGARRPDRRSQTALAGIQVRVHARDPRHRQQPGAGARHDDPRPQPATAREGPAVPGSRDRGTSDRSGRARLLPLSTATPRPTSFAACCSRRRAQPVLAAVGAVERAGLKVGRVDLSSFGTLRAIADEQLTVEAIVDLGAHLTTIVIHDRGVPKLVRTLARGGQEITDSARRPDEHQHARAERPSVTTGSRATSPECAGCWSTRCVR